MFPHFLGIGAGRSGTTWLYENIRQHPDVWMPPIKELHYFDHSGHLPLLFEALFTRDSLWRLELRRYAKVGLRQMRQRAARQAHRGWYARYFLLPRSDVWYAGLFSPRSGQLAGDITPGYGRLDEAGVARIHALLPAAKIIYLLRNPINALWSLVALITRQYDLEHKAAPTLSAQAILAFADGTHQAPGRAALRQEGDLWEHYYWDYARSLEIWERYYPQSQLFVGFFEQLAESPRELLGEILSFLDLPTSSAHIPDSVERKVNAPKYEPIPPHLARRLARQHYDSIARLHQRFDNRYTAGWLRDAQALLAA